MYSVVQNDDVLFHWSIIAANWIEEDVKVLLKLITQEWITLRGHSFVSSFMETFKREKKKTLQKSKGTRKNLIGEHCFLRI